MEALKAAGVDATFSSFPIGPESRLNAEMKAGNLHLAFIPPSTDRLRLMEEGAIKGIRIPLERGLLGYRICLVSEKNSDILKDVSTVEDLRRFSIGQGVGWGDAAVYRKAGIQVLEAPFSSMLDPLKMLASGQFDLFPLGVNEYELFLAEYAKRHSGLATDKHILIRYPWFRFIWVSTTAPDSDILFAALDKGFESIVSNGPFETVYEQYKGTLDAKRFTNRTIIDLQSPYGGSDSVDPRFRHLILSIP